MVTTKRAEEWLKNNMTEQEKKLGDKFAAYSILPKAEQRGFLIAYRLLEDEIDELTKEVERLRKDRELFEKRCVNLSKSTDEILEYLIPFVDNYLDDNDINRIIKWHNDNSNRH